MKKVFVQTFGQERFDILHQFLSAKGYSHNFTYVDPEKVPFSDSEVIKLLQGNDSEKSLPQVCIMDMMFKHGYNGEEAFSAFQYSLARAKENLMPVIYLLQNGQSIRLYKTCRYVYWPYNTPFKDVEKKILDALESLTKTTQSFGDMIIDSV